MAGKVDIHDRSYEFALRAMRLVRHLPNRTEGYVLGKQLLRASTSIAANIEEAQAGYSKHDFIYKMNIAFKEARETNLWLRMIRDGRLIEANRINELLKESAEIRNILGTIVRHSRSAHS